MTKNHPVVGILKEKWVLSISRTLQRPGERNGFERAELNLIESN